jgi:hypothetical protein
VYPSPNQHFLPFFLLNFHQLVTPKNPVPIIHRIFVKKYAQKSADLEGKNPMKSPYVDNRFQQVAKVKQDSEEFLLSSLTCSQIWLMLLVDTIACAHHNFSKEKPNTWPRLSSSTNAECVAQQKKIG